jgi:F-type H+-transporting ATPase subunit a
MALEKTRKWRYGVNRWVVLAMIILSVIFSIIYSPIQPHIQVAPEAMSETPLFALPVIGPFFMTNTLWAMVLEDIIIFIIIALVGVGLRKSKDSLLPIGFAGAMEALLEMLYNLTESTAGRAAKKIFPWFVTIMIVVLIANWFELLPGVDSIGFLEHSAHGYPTSQIAPGVVSIVKGSATTEGGYSLTSFVRVASTDLNFTIALALISVFMTQVIGLQAQGVGYFSKFFNFRTLFSKPVFGAIDVLVGVLELVSELSKILSFGFRLFGNLFAGTVLLFLVGAMVPIFAPSMILMFEFFIGAIQAFVFGMLTMVFMSQATVGHGEHEQVDETGGAEKHEI